MAGLCALKSPAIDGIQRVQHVQRFAAADAVVDVLAVAPGADQAAGAQHSELLGQRRLADVEQFLQLADALLALRELAKQQQAILVGKHAQ